MGRVDDSGWKDPAVMADEDENFLPRWSRRKLGERDAQGKTGAVADPAVSDSTQVEAAEAAAVEPHRELTVADMPPVDTLDEHSDYTAFMSPKVSDRLRAQAFRRLFHLPAYNITDCLNDYDDDYTRFTGLWKIVNHEMKRMLKRELEESETAGELSEPETVVAEAQIPDSGETNATANNYEAENDYEKVGV